MVVILPRGISLTIVAGDSCSMEMSFCCNSNTGRQIPRNLCACYDSTAVVSCAKFCSDHIVWVGVMAKPNFHRLQRRSILRKASFVSALSLILGPSNFALQVVVHFRYCIISNDNIHIFMDTFSIRIFIVIHIIGFSQKRKKKEILG